MAKLNYLSTGYAIADEIINRTSSTALRIGHDLVMGTGFEIWTGAGKTGTKLTLTTDYVLNSEATDYTTKVGTPIYTKLSIVNGTYLNTNLYVTYTTVGDYASVENIAQASMETVTVSTNTTLTAYQIGTRKRIYNSHTSAVVITMPTGVTVNGVSSFVIYPKLYVDIEVISATAWLFCALPKIFVSSSSEQLVTPDGTYKTFAFNAKNDVWGAFNLGNGIFTAPITGTYNFSFHATATLASSTTGYIFLTPYVNGSAQTRYTTKRVFIPSSGCEADTQVQFQLNAGNSVYFACISSGNTGGNIAYPQIEIVLISL